MAKTDRSTRSTAKNASHSTEKAAPKGRKAKSQATSRSKKVKPSFSESDDREEVQEDKAELESDAYREESDEDDVVSLHSDALDGDEDDVLKPQKRKRAPNSGSRSKSGVKRSSPLKKSPGRKKRKVVPAEESEGGEEIELEEGQEIVGVVVQAPKTGRVPPGQISKNTFAFLSELKNSDHNDREWFKLHEPVYRLAEKEWKDFIEVFTDLLVGADPQVPPLPPKDVIHRIYRDVRFSNDKTPYKTGLCASFSRSGRKGIFAKFEPGGNSIIAAGSWQPGKNELATIRNNILRSSKRLRDIISSPAFVKLFGEANPDPTGGRRNVFGFEDELKTAPKGISKTHKDIDLLKCRSIAVMCKVSDKQVLSPDFKDELTRIVKVLRPFVHCLNDMMTLPPTDSDSGSNEEDESEVEE